MLVKKNGERKLLKVTSDKHAVSQVVSVLLVVSMVVAMMTVILFWAMPLIEEKRSENEMQSVFYSFEIMDNTVEGLLMEGSDAKRVVGVVCPNDRGDLSFVTSNEKLIVMYTYDVDVGVGDDDAYEFAVDELEDEGENDGVFEIHFADVADAIDLVKIYYLKPDDSYIYSGDPFFIIPDDLADPPSTNPKEDSTITDLGGGVFRINTGGGYYKLEGDLLIDLFDTGCSNTIPIGRIWVFELGCVTYKAYYNFGNQETVFENGAIMSTGVQDKGIINNPALIITNDKKSVALRVIQLQAVGRNSFSGRTTPKVEFDLKNSFKREKPTSDLLNHGDMDNYHVNNLKFQIFGENEQVWLDYFTNMADFDTVVGVSNTVGYNTDGINFILDSSFIEVDVGL